MKKLILMFTLVLSSHIYAQIPQELRDKELSMREIQICIKNNMCPYSIFMKDYSRMFLLYTYKEKLYPYVVMEDKSVLREAVEEVLSFMNGAGGFPVNGFGNAAIKKADYYKNGIILLSEENYLYVGGADGSFLGLMGNIKDFKVVGNNISATAQDGTEYSYRGITNGQLVSDLETVVGPLWDGLKVTVKEFDGKNRHEISLKKESL